MPQATNGEVDTSSTDPQGWRKDIEKSFAAVQQVISKSLSPVTRYTYPPNNDDQTKMTGILADLRKIGFKDVETLLTLLNSQVKGVQDDNDFLLEHLVQLLAKLPEHSRTSNQLTGAFINQLWNQLPHPPIGSLGSKYKYREADGSFNNIRIPDIGQAGTPYARSVQPNVMQNIALPDPGSIFDSLMARPDGEFEPHPNKISSMLFYLATIIIHDLFRTDHKDYTISKASSYLDLAPLYGSSQEEQDKVRTFKDGKLKPDCFSEKRVLGFPPGVGVYLIMFNRFHNYVVTQLALINENGRFNKPKDSLSGAAATAAWKKYDNDLFQVGRLITGGLYVNCVLKDYVRTILSLNRSGSTWDLDPRTDEIKTLFNNPAAEGIGNQCSAEFNLIYRWHSALSERDDKWTQDKYAELFPGRNPVDVTLPELISALGVFEKNLPDDPVKRPFAGLKRQENGNFDDDSLVDILEASISDVSGSFGANKVPKILRSVEILGIIQARSWDVGSLNEFRSFVGLTKHTTFEDINPDPVVAERLRNLYDNVDSVEMYPGLVAEKPKPPMSPGSGLCVNFTTSYSILSDAVALVRGDRFYTTDYTPKNLTNWGYNEVLYDTTVDEGQVMYKLILRAFPHHFKGNSVYAHYPFVIPEENLKILKSLGRADKYTWEKPKQIPDVVVINSPTVCKKILEDKENFRVTWGKAIEFVASQSNKQYGADFALAGDGPANSTSRDMITKGLYPEHWKSEVQSFYEETTTRLLKKYSYKVPGTHSSQVDIIRDVTNLVNTRFAASVFSLPIKTEETPRGIYEEHELYQVLSLLFIYIFRNADPAKSLQIQEAAKTLTQQLGELVLLNTEAIAASGFVADLVAKLHQKTPLTDYGTHMIQRLLASGKPIKDVVWTHLMPTIGAGTANQSGIFAEAFDYYLGEGKQHVPALYTLAHQDTHESDEKLLRYFLEGARLRSTTALYRDYIPSEGQPDVATFKEGKDTISVPAGHRIFLDFPVAHRDPAVFPEPNEVRLDRPIDSYLLYGWGPHQCLGEDVTKTAMVAMFRIIFGLKNLRRAPWGGFGENWGEIKKVPGPLNSTRYMSPDQSTFYPFPTTMKVCWDED
ncbi:linoleate diol synthase [Phlyctema vagabunda]|uniref:Linoleate diol synthase n=1 Tax=Phlyctema vagabunda TaxID=108571 RepID=A0ABR4PJE9_9HELO